MLIDTPTETPALDTVGSTASKSTEMRLQKTLLRMRFPFAEHWLNES
jgi:hypothetical protein